MARERFHIQQLAGYTDGKPSWAKVPEVPYMVTTSRESATQHMVGLRAKHPARKYRLRRVLKR